MDLSALAQHSWLCPSAITPAAPTRAPVVLQVQARCAYRPSPPQLPGSLAGPTPALAHPVALCHRIISTSSAFLPSTFHLAKSDSSYDHIATCVVCLRRLHSDTVSAPEAHLAPTGYTSMAIPHLTARHASWRVLACAAPACHQPCQPVPGRPTPLSQPTNSCPCQLCKYCIACSSLAYCSTILTALITIRMVAIKHKQP